MRLKETHFADALGRDPAGSEIRHASGFKFDAGVGDVHFAGEDGHSHGANFCNRRIYERKHGVEIVNHQVEHHVHIERARIKNAQPVDFEKHWLGDEWDRSLHGGVEAFEMSNLRDSAGGFCQRDQFIGFGQRSRQRLFDEDVNAGLHQSACGRQVMNRGHRHRRRLNFAVGRDQLLDRSESAAVEFFGDCIGASEVGIHHSD